jgi:3-dehydroquinate dehydratase type I
LEGIVGESTKNRFGARIIGIVTAANRTDPAIWDALADCQMAELRADGFERSTISREAGDFRGECIRRFGHPLETLLTIRLKRDGGAWPDSEAPLREEVWQSLGLEGNDPVCDWVDVEVEEIASVSARTRSLLASGAAKLLLSHHDMRKSLPREGLRGLMLEMQRHRPAGMKFALTCGTPEELLDLLLFAREVAAATADGCVLSMGPTGRSSRVLAPMLGCPLTYGFLTGGAVAPGQLSVRELRNFYRDLSPDRREPEIDSHLLDWAEAQVLKTLRWSVSGRGDTLAD